MSDDGTAELWTRYRATRSLWARDQLVQAYWPLVKRVADVFRFRRGIPMRISLGELLSFGGVGLWKAIEDFNPALGVPFGAYARRRISWAMLDGLQSLDVVRQRSKVTWEIPLIGRITRGIARRMADPRPVPQPGGDFLRLVRKANLSPLEREIITRHYLGGEELKALAAERDVTPSWITQLHKKMLRRLSRNERLQRAAGVA